MLEFHSSDSPPLFKGGGGEILVTSPGGGESGKLKKEFGAGLLKRGLGGGGADTFPI